MYSRQDEKNSPKVRWRQHGGVGGKTRVREPPPWCLVTRSSSSTLLHHPQHLPFGGRLVGSGSHCISQEGAGAKKIAYKTKINHVLETGQTDTRNKDSQCRIPKGLSFI